MQRLPYVVVTNRHISDVYELYYDAFDTFRRVGEIKTLDDNDALCRTISSMLRAHLTVIPKLAMGVLECAHLVDPDELDGFMNTVLRSRISRRTRMAAATGRMVVAMSSIQIVIARSQVSLSC